MELNLFTSDDFNSVRSPSTYGYSRFGATIEGTIDVAVERLDGIYDDLVDGCRRVFLKIDTQGHDLAVLDGLGSKKVCGVQLELSAKAVYDATPSMSQAIEHVAALGFEPIGFFPVSRDRDHLRVIEFDGLFLAP